jgi:hypothetical protein
LPQESSTVSSIVAMLFSLCILLFSTSIAFFISAVTFLTLNISSEMFCHFMYLLLVSSVLPSIPESTHFCLVEIPGTSGI